MKLYEILSLIILFLVGTILWTLPIQQDNLPFGEGDAAWHFANGDYATKANHVYWKLPFYISVWYYDYNKILGPGALEYPPAYHMGYSVFQIIGGQQFVPVYILIAISSFLSAFAIFLLLRKLYDFPTALVAATAMIFSFREILVYLWGQRPTILAFAFIPLILYVSFKYLEGYYKNNQKLIYLYISSILIILQFLIHPQGSMLSLTAILLYVIIQSIIKKKLPINKLNILHIIILLVVTAIIIVPFINIYRGAGSGLTTDIKLQNIGRLFSWVDVQSRQGYPNDLGGPPIVFYNEKQVYFPFYYVILWVGILYLVLRRNDEDILILCWLGALYLLLHLDVLGLLPFARISRFLMGETVLFYSIMAIGVIESVKLFIKNNQKLPIIILTGILIVGIIFYNGTIAYNALNKAYAYPLRISKEQYRAAQWIDKNLPSNAYLYYVGVLTYPKQRFMYILSYRPGIWQNDRTNYPWMNVTHVVVDYSDALRVNDKNLLAALTNYEQQFVNVGIFPVYNVSNIKIYNIQGAKIGK